MYLGTLKSDVHVNIIQDVFWIFWSHTHACTNIHNHARTPHIHKPRTHTPHTHHTHTHTHTTHTYHTHKHTPHTHTHNNTHTTHTTHHTHHTHPHTQKHTHGMTPLNDRSARRSCRYLHNTQQNEGTNIHAISGIRNRDTSNGAAADQHVRPLGHRDRHIAVLLAGRL